MLLQCAHRELRGASLARSVDDQVAIQRQGNARGQAHGALEGRIPAGVPAGVEVGEAIQGLRVAGRIAQQVGDAEIHAAASSEDFLANGTVHRVGVILRIGFRESDADLHRPAGMHRVEVAEEFPPQRHHVDEIVEDRAQFLLGTRGIEPLAVGLARGRIDLQRGVHHECRDMQTAGAAQDLLPGDLRQPRYRRVHLVGGLLLGDRQHRTEVAIARRDALGGEGRLDIGGPALTVGSLRRQQADHLGAHLGRPQDRLLRALGAAGGQGEQHDNGRETGEKAHYGVVHMSCHAVDARRTWHERGCRASRAHWTASPGASAPVARRLSPPAQAAAKAQHSEHLF
ncbi:hypothetical protein D9M68_626170 [compost metagenome]